MGVSVLVDAGTAQTIAGTEQTNAARLMAFEVDLEHKKICSASILLPRAALYWRGTFGFGFAFLIPIDVGLKTNSLQCVNIGGQEEKKGGRRKMIRIIRYLNKRRVTITIAENGDVTVIVEPPPQGASLNSRIFQTTNP